MRKTFLPFSPPFIGEQEITEVVDTLHSDWITTGPKVKRFEDEFRAFVGAPAALALNSCTAALHVSLLTSGIGPGDAVITSPLTFCSSVNVIEHVGAQPILVDVEPDTLNVDPNKILERIHEHAAGSSPSRASTMIKALLPVHLYGHPCEMDSILDIARDYDLTIIEDAAHSLPARYKDKVIGSSCSNPTVLTCFSFYATKNLTTAEGGMLTGPATLLETARIWGLHGMSRNAWDRYSEKGSWRYEVVKPGFKYNMTDIQAALGLQQLRKLQDFQARRRTIVNRYNMAFSKFNELEIPVERPTVEHAWHLYVLRLNLSLLTLERDRFIEELKERNIGSSVHFIPIHLHPFYRRKYRYRPDDFPIALNAFSRIVSLPLNPRMSDDDVQDVIDAVSAIIINFRK